MIDHVEKGRKRRNVEVLGTMFCPAMQCGKREEDWWRKGSSRSWNVRSVLKWRTPG
jgi:hypothetical protein